MTKKLHANRKSVIPFIRLDEASPAAMEALINRAPRYLQKDWKKLVRNTIGAIHQVPKLFVKPGIKKLKLKDIEAYFGRSSHGKNYPGTNISNCFRRGLHKRKHEFGMVFGQTTIKASTNFERWGFRLIEHLQAVNGLCIANRTRVSRGIYGSTEPGLLYLTFSIAKNDEDSYTLTQKEIDSGLRKIMKEIECPTSERTVARSGIKNGLILANDTKFLGKTTLLQIKTR